MTPFFLECVANIVAESKTKGFFKTSDSVEATIQEAHQSLQPLTKYLETTLILLSEKLYAEICQVMVKKIWKAIIRCFKTVLLPSVDEGILSSRQLSMIGKCLQVLYDFFAADGKGLEEKVCLLFFFLLSRWKLQLNQQHFSPGPEKPALP